MGLPRLFGAATVVGAGLGLLVVRGIVWAADNGLISLGITSI